MSVDPGFARVWQLLSQRADAMYTFRDWTTGSMRAIEELPVGCYVLVLPRLTRDLGWCPVITLDDTARARFTYIHPAVIQPVSVDKPVVVGHALERNGRRASHDIGRRRPGVRCIDGEIVLDARWGHDGGECSGHCSGSWIRIAVDPIKLGCILQFAAYEGDVVCCERAAHRSVATAYILQYAFGRRINWNHAATWRECEVEPRCRFGQDGVSALWSSFRAIPQRVNPCRLLQYALGLPGCLVPFDTHYMPHTDELNLRSAVPNYELTQASNLVSALPEMDEQ